MSQEFLTNKNNKKQSAFQKYMDRCLDDFESCIGSPYYECELPFGEQKCQIQNQSDVIKVFEKKPQFNKLNIALTREHLYIIQYYIQHQYLKTTNKQLCYYFILAILLNLQDLIKEIESFIKKNQQIELTFTENIEMLTAYDIIFEYYDSNDENQESGEIILNNLLKSNPKFIIDNSPKIVQIYKNMKGISFKNLIERQVKLIYLQGKELDVEKYRGLFLLKYDDKEDKKKKVEEFLKKLEGLKTVVKDKEIQELKEQNKMLQDQNKELLKKFNEQKEKTAKLTRDYERQLKVEIDKIQEQAGMQILLNQSNLSLPQPRSNIASQVQPQQFVNNNNSIYDNNVSNSNYYNNNNSNYDNNNNSNSNQVSVSYQPQQLAPKIGEDIVGIHHNDNFCQGTCKQSIAVHKCGCRVCRTCLSYFIAVKDYQQNLSKYKEKCWVCKNQFFSDEDYIPLS
ncbi:hypothetical protein PPERSA_03803 [Pseudocohnilembus persalinus]|uniref:Uncharacterized protein n=1 Tax=Pseudocohnilembus persalinus TaxID=266149 RepID=A0A0V0QV04_PSEPJ|nr:hypothetical protein PPERSA_03803 [Pseudocohnilembus persalinus]|eukprot:KRX05866.1 hypothetical protein PPERSA_03803 [Pseudocohnilembus persalinus]